MEAIIFNEMIIVFIIYKGDTCPAYNMWKFSLGRNLYMQTT